MSAADVAYIKANYVALEALCEGRDDDMRQVRLLIEGGRLPAPSYVLVDGSEMVPTVFFELHDHAAGREEEEFQRRFLDAANRIGISPDVAEVSAEWEAYLSGDYGVCLWSATPENICLKGFHMRSIEQLLGEPDPENPVWCDALAHHVAALDELERPFADYDRVRWGPVSRPIG